MQTFGTGNYKVFAAAWTRQCSSTRTGSVAGRGAAGWLNVVTVELNGVRRQDVGLAIHRVDRRDVAVGDDGGVVAQLAGLLQDGPGTRQRLEDLAPLLDGL